MSGLFFQSFDGWKNEGTISLPLYVATFTKAVCLYPDQKDKIPEQTLRDYLTEKPKGLDSGDFDMIDAALKVHPLFSASPDWVRF